MNTARTGEMGDTGSMRVARARENVFEVTATGQELSALVAGARPALDGESRTERAPFDQPAMRTICALSGDPPRFAT
jgi:hypothetical protein